VATAEQIDDPVAFAWALELIGIYHSGIGHWARAQTVLEQAAATAHQCNERRRWEEVTGLLGAVAYGQGDFLRSHQLYSEANLSIRRRWAAGDIQFELPGLAG
jgi:hypothetical protein